MPPREARRLPPPRLVASNARVARIATGTAALAPDAAARARPALPQGQPAAEPTGRPLRQTGLADGTLILTANGLRPVETLRRGDLVATLLPRGPFFVPVAWVGYRSAATDRLGGRDSHPVLIRRNAIADGIPATDLLLAPEHAIYLGTSLYIVRMLVNGASIVHRKRPQGAPLYWGFRLEIPNVALAQNLPVETLMQAATAGYVDVAEQPPVWPPPRAAGRPKPRLVTP